MELIVVLCLCLVSMALLCISVGWRWYRTRKVRVFVTAFVAYLPAIVELVLGIAYIKGDYLPAPVVKWCQSESMVHLIYPILLAGHCVASIIYEVNLHFNTITRSSIQTAVNEMDNGLLYMLPDGIIVLINRRMTRLALDMMGGYQINGNIFWSKLISFSQNDICKRIDFTQWPAFLFTNGEVWSFEKHYMVDADRNYIEIVAKNVTQLYYQREGIREETQKLKSVQVELNRVMRSISETVNDEELLNYKIRIHDQLGNAIIRTRKALRAPNLQKQNVEEILQVWENTVKAFKQNMAESKPGEEGDIKEVYDQAKALGINLIINGEFPDTNPVCVRAVREAMYNSIRHAYANTITVDSSKTEDGYFFRISDDGTTKIPKVVEGGGLSSLRKAVEEIGGEMTVSVWEGVELSFFFPVKGQEQGV